MSSRHAFLVCDPLGHEGCDWAVLTRNWKEIQGAGCNRGRLRTKCKGVKKQMALFIWKCSGLHPLCRLVTHRLTTSCILWVFLTLGHCLTLKWYTELQWQKLKWGILESFMQNASSYYDNILPPPPIVCTHNILYVLCHRMRQEFCLNVIRLLARWQAKQFCLYIINNPGFPLTKQQKESREPGLSTIR